jgi:hypothetical protein
MTDNQATPESKATDATPKGSEAEEKKQESMAVDLSRLSLDETLTGCEQYYDLLRRTDWCEELYVHLMSLKAANLNINELLKNGDTLLCLACTKNYEKIVRALCEEFSADINLCRSLAATSTSFSTVTPTISITARRQSRLMGKSESIAEFGLFVFGHMNLWSAAHFQRIARSPGYSGYLF